MEKKLLASTKKDPAFLIKGFTYWKEATTAFQKHQASMCHKEATEALIHLPQQVQGDIGELLNKEHLAAKAHNRKMFLVILESIRFLARQGFPLRGHLSDADSNITSPGQSGFSSNRSMDEQKSQQVHISFNSK